MQTMKQRRGLAWWLNREWGYQNARSHSDGGIAFRSRLFPDGLPSERRRIAAYGKPQDNPEPICNAELITLDRLPRKVAK